MNIRMSELENNTKQCDLVRESPDWEPFQELDGILIPEHDIDMVDDKGTFSVGWTMVESKENQGRNDYILIEKTCSFCHLVYSYCWIFLLKLVLYVGPQNGFSF